MEQLLSTVAGLVIITTHCDIVRFEHGWLWFVCGCDGLLSWNEQGANNYDMHNKVLEVSQLKNVKIIRESEHHKRCYIELGPTIWERDAVLLKQQLSTKSLQGCYEKKPCNFLIERLPWPDQTAVFTFWWKIQNCNHRHWGSWMSLIVTVFPLRLTGTSR